MATIDIIRRKVRNREYEFTVPHFFEEMASDDLQLADIESAILHGKIRRRFTRDPRGARFGVSTDERQVAIICTGKLLFITTYVFEPA